MLTALATLPTMAQQQGDPFSTFDIRIDAPPTPPVQIPNSDAVLALNMQIERLTGDPRQKPKGVIQKGLFGELV